MRNIGTSRPGCYPLSATAQGDNRYNDQLPNDQTRAFRQQQQRFYQHYLTPLQQFDRAQLPADDQLSYDMFRYELETDLAGAPANSAG